MSTYPAIRAMSLLTCALLLPTASYAMKCTSTAPQMDQLDSTVAVPSTLPSGTVIWRSSKQIEVQCTREAHDPVSAKVYLTAHPEPKPAGNPGFSIGLEYEGRDYWEPQAIEVSPCVPGTDRCDATTARPLSIKILIRKEEGVLADPQHRRDSYPLFSLSTEKESLPAYTYTLNNLRHMVRPTPCAVAASFSPNTIDFGEYTLEPHQNSNTLRPQRGKGPIQHTTLRLERSCTAPVDIAGYVTSAYGPANFSPGGGTAANLVWENDRATPTGLGVALSFSNASDSIPLYKPVPLVTFLEGETNKAVDFSVSLHTDPLTTLRPGRFVGALTIELLYR